MNLELFNKYIVKTDLSQYILYQKRQGRDFKVLTNAKGIVNYSNFHNPSYHSTFEQVLKKIKEYEILNSRVKTIDELMVTIKAIDELIKTIQEKFQ